MLATELESVLKELAPGKIFSVKFVKRSTGEIRHMTCRFGVTKGVKGDSGLGKAYEPNAKGLICVYDVQNQGYRMIAVEGIKELKIAGKTYTA